MLDSALKSHKQGLGSEKGQKTMAQKTVLRTFVSHGLGTSGDVYLDLTLGSLALYGRYLEEWKIWRGPQSGKTEDLVVHPSHPNRCLWCSETSCGWFALTFAQGKSSAHLTASDALSAAKDSQIGTAEKRRKRKATTELQEPVPKKMNISSTNSRPIPELNPNFSEITASSQPLFLPAAMNPHPTPTSSNSVVSLNALPPHFQRSMLSFELSTLTESSTPPPDSNRVTPVRYAKGLSQVESGRTSPDTWSDKRSQIKRSPATMPEQPHRGKKSVEHSHSDLQNMGLHRSSSKMGSADVTLPVEVHSKQLIRATGSNSPILNAGQRPHVELPRKAHILVDTVQQPPRLITCDDVPVVVPSTLEITLSSQPHDRFILSGADQRSFQEQNMLQQPVELHTASERDTQRIREAHEEIERLKAENVVLKNQLRENVHGRATHAATLSDHTMLPSLAIMDGYQSTATISLASSPRTTGISLPDDPSEPESICAPSFLHIPDGPSSSSQHVTMSSISAARVSASVFDNPFPRNPMTTPHLLPQEGDTTDDNANSSDAYLPRTALLARHLGGGEHGSKFSEEPSPNPIPTTPVSFRESNLDPLMNAYPAFKAKVSSLHPFSATEPILISNGPAISGIPSEHDFNETLEMAPGFVGGIQEPLAPIATGVPAEAGAFSISQMGSTAALKAESDVRHHNSSSPNGDTFNRTKIGDYDSQDLLIHCNYPASWLKEMHISILFADERDSMICRICLAKGEEIFRVYKADSLQCFKVMEQHCDKQHPDETEMLVNLTEEELCVVWDKLSSVSEG